jgi:hypothetical protein
MAGRTRESYQVPRGDHNPPINKERQTNGERKTIDGQVQLIIT